MRKNIVGILAFAALSIMSCKKQLLMTYESANSIYFAPAVFNMPLGSSPLLDSTAVSFALGGSSTKDSSIKLYVVVTGAPADQDRAYNLVVDSDSSTATPGVHFVEPAPIQYIRAGKVRDTINLKLLRTADMQDSNYKIIFRLPPNENFNNAMEYKMTSATRRLNYTKYTVYVTDILKKPARWLDAYLGSFTRKKLFLICEQLNTTPSYLDAQISVADVNFFGKYMQRYLNQMAVDGNPVYEDDGSRMTMGPSVQ
ncbi:DUF4843 domain-containing protein [Niabella sp. CJ426]|uniref:DUF4843 domain-containing protein n=1 Tax=Niabella sp. CJ426 TaxID=3393740 RepID=UPI003D049492